MTIKNHISFDLKQLLKKMKKMSVNIMDLNITIWQIEELQRKIKEFSS